MSMHKQESFKCPGLGTHLAWSVESHGGWSGMSRTLVQDEVGPVGREWTG